MPSRYFARALFLAALIAPQLLLAEDAPRSELDEIIVTLSGHERRRFDVIQGSTVLEGDALRREVAATLGDTLESQTGVTTTGFAPGSSRPVIRGQGGPRLRVLQNGLASIDVSANSPDHQVAAPPLLAERIEVLRGAGALRYGSNAVGGVVNVLDGRIAERLPATRSEGALDLHHGSNAEVRRGAFALRASDETRVLYLNLFGRRSHDLEVRGRALSDVALMAADIDEDPLHDASGSVPDTHANTDGGTLGISRVGERGHFGVAYTQLNSNYGLPVAHGHDDADSGGGGAAPAPDPTPDPDAGHDDEEALSLYSDLVQHRFDIAASYKPRAGFVQELKLRAGYADYEHAEVESGHEGEENVGTLFENRGYDFRAEFVQRERDGLDGSFGFEHRLEERKASGEEAFLPAHQTQSFAAYVSEELHRGRVTFEGGARFEHSARDPATAPPVECGEVDLALRPAQDARSFNNWSASLGAAFTPVEHTTLGLALARTERPPTAEELYACGPHFGTGGFEIGDSALDAETAWSLEFSAKRRRGRVSGVLNLYATRFDQFIFPRDTDKELDGLIQREYGQRDARFHGAELDLTLQLYEFARGRAQLELGLDTVRGAFQHAPASEARHLPRIPPWSAQLGATLEFARARFGIEGRYTASQRRIAENETPSASYFVVNVEAALHLNAPAQSREVTLFLQARNLTNARGRNHVSFLKERLPIAGRDLRLGLRWHF